jgi:hypothetical protein
MIVLWFLWKIRNDLSKKPFGTWASVLPPGGLLLNRSLFQSVGMIPVVRHIRCGIYACIWQAYLYFLEGEFNDLPPLAQMWPHERCRVAPISHRVCSTADWCVKALSIVGSAANTRLLLLHLLPPGGVRLSSTSFSVHVARRHVTHLLNRCHATPALFPLIRCPVCGW